MGMTYRISIIGSGGVGGAVGKVFAKYGYQVIFYDVDQERRKELASQGYEVAEELAEAVLDTDISFICVPTPTENGWLDRSYFDGVICPSIAHEGFGLVVLEALRYNGVVIASDIFVKTGVVREDVGFVYPRGDARALASRMMKALLLSDSERSRLQGKASRWAERFDWERHVSELEKLLASASNLLPNQILTKP